MGSILCKERSPRRVYAKGSPNGAQTAAQSIYGQQQIHPSSLTSDDGTSPKRFSNTKSNFFHSTPNLNDGQMNSTLSLDPRIFDSGSRKTPPVAPPRKRRSTLKKGSTLPTNFESDGSVRNGFKDVFISGGASRVLKYDDIEYIDKDESVLQKRSDSKQEGDTLERKLKVGNKKTDKFFGENLSDHLSDEPVTPVEIRKDVSKDEADRSSNPDKKLSFLLNMLDKEFAEEHKYLGKEPIEEPIFVARKKEIKKHICDDDDHMHHQHFHNHEKEANDHVVAPPKPDRDFSKYQANVTDDEKPSEEEVKVEKVQEVKLETVKSEKCDEETQTKMLRIKKAISRESLPTPPEAPKRKTGAGSSPSTPTITVESIDFVTTYESKPKAEEKVEETKTRELKRPPSMNLSKQSDYENEIIGDEQSPSTPIISHEIVDQMLKTAYGFHGYHPEDHSHNHDDGSNLVAPTSKLTTRKISTTRKVSTESTPSIDGDLLATKSSGSPQPPGSPQMKPMKRDFEKILNATSVNDIIEEIYSKNSEIMQEFQSYLEHSIDSTPVINVDEEKAFLKTKGIRDNEFICTPEPEKQTEAEDEIEESQTYSDSFESSDTEQETDLAKLKSKLPKFNTRRRESIEDVDGWFNNHLNLEQKQSELCGSMDITPTGPPNYDMQKTFPFGRTIHGRRDSLSDEFFSEASQSLIKPQMNAFKERGISISEGTEKAVEEKEEDRKDPNFDSDTLNGSLIELEVRTVQTFTEITRNKISRVPSFFSRKQSFIMCDQYSTQNYEPCQPSDGCEYSSEQFENAESCFNCEQPQSCPPRCDSCPPSTRQGTYRVCEMPDNYQCNVDQNQLARDQCQSPCYQQPNCGMSQQDCEPCYDPCDPFVERCDPCEPLGPCRMPCDDSCQLPNYPCPPIDNQGPMCSPFQRRRYVQPPRRESCKPVIRYQRPSIPMAEDTIYKKSFDFIDCQTAASCRMPPIRPSGQLRTPCGDFAKETIAKLSFQSHCCPERSRPIMPQSHQLLGMGPMQGLTTQKHDFVPKFQYKRLKFAPRNNIQTPCGCVERSTIQKLSFMPPDMCNFSKAESCKPIICYKPPDMPMEFETTQKLSYMANCPPEKEDYPWARKSKYCPPTVQFARDTVAKLSYQPPGCFLDDNGFCYDVKCNDFPRASC